MSFTIFEVRNAFILTSASIGITLSYYALMVYFFQWRKKNRKRGEGDSIEV